jgi:hypothetical protein
LREGVVEVLAGAQKQDLALTDLPVTEVDTALAYPLDAVAARAPGGSPHAGSFVHYFPILR